MFSRDYSASVIAVQAGLRALVCVVSMEIYSRAAVKWRTSTPAKAARP